MAQLYTVSTSPLPGKLETKPQVLQPLTSTDILNVLEELIVTLLQELQARSVSIVHMGTAHSDLVRRELGWLC